MAGSFGWVNKGESLPFLAFLEEDDNDKTAQPEAAAVEEEG